MKKNTFYNWIFILLPVLSFTISNDINAQTITPDLTFGENGIVSGTQPFYDATTVCMQPDGKILVAGSAYTATTYFDYAIARFNTDGSADTSFGNAGFVTFDHQELGNRIYAIAITPAGKILALGDSTSGLLGAASRFILLQFNPDGSKDLSFGNQGMVMASLANRTDQPRDMKITPDGKIIVAGISSYLRNFNSNQLIVSLLVARHNPDGSPDISFNGVGYLNKVGGYLNNSNFAITLDDEGSIFIGCSKRLIPFVLGYPCITKVLSNGTLDSTFGTDGEKSFAGASGSILGLCLQPDGKIIATGGSATSGTLLRMLPNGDPDNTFGNAGMATVSNSSGNVESGVQTILLEDGKMITGFRRSAGGNYDLSLLLTHADGTPDASAGEGGFAISVQPGKQVTKAIARQEDGKIIVVGQQDDYGFSMARFNVDNNLSLNAVNNNHIIAYPNPVKDKLRLDNVSPGTNFYLFDSLGRNYMVPSYNSDTASAVYLDFESLPNGNYFLKIQNGWESTVLKILK